jgi:hypothetical protein
MNKAVGIPATLEALRAEDIPELARAACWEADTNYPVPKYLSPRHVEALLAGLLAKGPRATRR